VKGWLPDTNVVSELRKPRCDARVRAWADRQQPQGVFPSTVTVAEIRFGVERLDASDPRQRQLESWLADELRPWLEDRLIAVDEDVIVTWSRLVKQRRAMRRSFLQPDSFLAATAALHDLCVATRNTGDFAATRVPVLNPWTDTEPRLPAN
jgi:toxin FitB